MTQTATQLDARYPAAALIPGDIVDLDPRWGDYTDAMDRVVLLLTRTEITGEHVEVSGQVLMYGDIEYGRNGAGSASMVRYLPHTATILHRVVGRMDPTDFTYEFGIRAAKAARANG